MRLGEVAIKITDDETLALELRGKAFQIVVAAAATPAAIQNSSSRISSFAASLLISRPVRLPDFQRSGISIASRSGRQRSRTEGVEGAVSVRDSEAGRGRELSYQLIGYDHQTDAFDAAKRKLPINRWFTRCWRRT